MNWKGQNGRICAETGWPRTAGVLVEPLVCCSAEPGLTKKKAKSGLLVAQGDHGIDFAGAACGNITGGERDQREQDGDDAEG
jgi:hypothetical protein